MKLTYAFEKTQDLNGDYVPDHSGLHADNTFDAWGFRGISIYIGTHWISALKMMEQVALIENDTPTLTDVQLWLAQAQLTVDTVLWSPARNYYLIDSAGQDGIMADAFSGQILADAVGLGDVLSRNKMVAHLSKAYDLCVVPMHDYTGNGIGDIGAMNGRTASGQEIDPSFYNQADQAWVGVTYCLAALMYERGMKTQALNTAFGAYYPVYEDNDLAYWFQTPEAWDIDGKKSFPADTPQYQRARAVWELMFAIERNEQWRNNHAPVASNQVVTLSEDACTIITLTATDPETNALAYSVTGNPIHGSLSGAAPNLTYRPATNYNGMDSFTFVASDGQLTSGVATVSITVTPVNDPPVASNRVVTLAEDASVAVTLTATDPETNALTYNIVANPTHGSLSGTAPNLTYRPATNYNGMDSFTFVASDGQLTSGVATVSITITPVNDPPIATTQLVTTAEDTAKALTLAGTDPDNEPIAGYAVVTPPAYGSLYGVLPVQTYTPNANYNGPDSFTFRVSDAGGLTSAPATVSITVTSVADPTVASNQSVVAMEDISVPVTLVATDADTTVLTYVIVSNPANGMLSGTAPNLTYKPAANYSGLDRFTFRANDANSTSAVAVVSITVNEDYLRERLAGYWRMNESLWNGTANQIKDSSPNLSHGAAVNGAITISTAKVGRCGYFDGVNDYAQIANKTNLQITGALTISLWAWPQNLGTGTYSLIEKKAAAEFALVIGTNRSLTFSQGTQAWSWVALPAGSLTNNAWQHIAVTRDPGTRTLVSYLNGVEVGSTVYPANAGAQPVISTNSLRIGTGYSGAYYKGRVDEVYLYAAALDSAYIEDAFYVEVPVGEWTMEEGAWSGVVGEIKDTSGFGVGGRSYNGATTVTNGQIGRAGYFDGTNDYAEIPNSAQLQVASNLSLSFWVRPYSITNRVNPMDKNFGGEFSLSIETNGSLTYQHGTNQSAGKYWTWSNALPAGSITNTGWSHIVVTRDRAQRIVRAYLNGVQRGTTNWPTTAALQPQASTNVIRIGKGSAPGYFRGLIDQVRIYDVIIASNRVDDLSYAMFDSDGDGLNDHDELAYGTDPQRPDTDGDKMVDGIEVLAGTIPTDPASKFDLLPAQGMDWNSEGILVRWASSEEKRYDLCRSTNLHFGFVTTASNIDATPPVNAYLDRGTAVEGVYYYQVMLRL